MEVSSVQIEEVTASTLKIQQLKAALEPYLRKAGLVWAKARAVASPTSRIPRA